jgi:predicted RNase H-like HicB family nuclease
MHLNIEIEQEEDGRWITEGLELPGVMAYGRTREESILKVQALTLRVLADQEHGVGVFEKVL